MSIIHLLLLMMMMMMMMMSLILPKFALAANVQQRSSVKQNVFNLFLKVISNMSVVHRPTYYPARACQVIVTTTINVILAHTLPYSVHRCPMPCNGIMNRNEATVPYISIYTSTRRPLSAHLMPDSMLTRKWIRLTRPANDSCGGVARIFDRKYWIKRLADIVAQNYV